MKTSNKTMWQHYLILVAVAIFFLTSLPNASAGFLDRTSSYDSKSQTYLIKSTILGIPTGDIAQVKLNTPEIYYVLPGNNRLVAEITINLYDNEYNNPLQDLKLINLKNGKEISRSIVYKQKIGTEGKGDITWKPIDISKITKGNTTIGLFTDVLPNEKIEWVYNDLMGIKADEWAIWTTFVIDNFDDGSINTIWNATGCGGSCILVEQPTGVLEMSIPNGGDCGGIHNITVETNMSFDIFTRYGNNISYSGLNLSQPNFVTINFSIYLRNSTYSATVASWTGAQSRTALNGTIVKNASGIYWWQGNAFVSNVSEKIGNNVSLGFWVYNDQNLQYIYVTLDNIAYSRYQTLFANLTSPVNYYNTTTGYNLNNITFNCGSATDDNAVINLTLVINGIDNYTIFNSSANQNLSMNHSIMMPGLAGAGKNYNWTCRATNGTDISSAEQTGTRTFTVFIPTLSRCNATYNTPLVNFTFKDESTNTYMNGSIDGATFYYWTDNQNSNTTYVYSNVTETNSTAFCIYPSYAPNISMSYQIQYSSDTYSSTSYPQRKYAITSANYVNSSTNIILYLLSSGDGIYSTIQTMASGGVVVSGVLLQIEREISGVWTLVSQGTTDDAGTSTFWVNPNFEHKITATKTGYASVTKNIFPTQSTYTIIMGTSGATGIYYSAYTQGLTYGIYPRSGILSSGTYNFSFEANYNNPSLTLQNCSFEFLNKSRDVINITYNLHNSTRCNPRFNNTYFNSSLYGRYSVEINGTWIVLEQDSHWYFIDINMTNGTGLDLLGAIREMYALPDWGENEATRDFSRIAFFFLFMAIILSAINFQFGYDTQYPGAVMYLLLGAIFLGSVANGLSGPGFFYLDVANLGTISTTAAPGALESSLQVMNNWIVFIFMFMIVFSATMMSIRRIEG